MNDPTRTTATGWTRDGEHITVPIPDGGHLDLTIAEAEALHAALCYALRNQPAGATAPDCRRSVQYGRSNRT